MNDEMKKLFIEVEKNADFEVQEYIKKLNGQIGQYIKEMLDKRLEDIILTAIGFERCKNGWKIDYLNHRNRESFIGTWIAENSAETIKTWLDKNIPNLPKLSKETIDNIKWQYSEQLEESLTELVVKKAKEDALKLVYEIIKIE